MQQERLEVCGRRPHTGWDHTVCTCMAKGKFHTQWQWAGLRGEGGGVGVERDVRGNGREGGEAKGRSGKLKKSAATKKVPSALLS